MLIEMYRSTLPILLLKTFMIRVTMKVRGGTLLSRLLVIIRLTMLLRGIISGSTTKVQSIGDKGKLQLVGILGANSLMESINGLI